jgi:diguanylate cyclase (GGDEF)-like protein
LLCSPAIGPDGSGGALLLVGALSLTGLIALMDYATGPELDLAFLYLVPVVACAWWGGIAHGILVALAVLVSWHVVDSLEMPSLSQVVALCNGVIRLGTLMLTSSLVARLHAGISREQQLARTDPLTGAANGRTFYQSVAVEAERARRAERPLTLAYFDLDNFKTLNDRLGHATGDAALLHVVATIRVSLRPSDLLARLGGDEFALLLPEVGAEGAASLLERLQQQLALEMARKGWPVTLSIGAITFLRPAWDIDVMIQEVDTLMYAAKRQGKGRVEHAVMNDAQPPSTRDRTRYEKRATARLLCNRLARIRPQMEEATEEFATISDLSATGVGLYLERCLEVDSVLIIDPLSSGVQSLLARVVHVHPDKRGWQHGCELSNRLSPAELRCWLGELENACP